MLRLFGSRVLPAVVSVTVLSYAVDKDVRSSSLMQGKKSGDPLDCEDPVCKSKIDLFKNAMGQRAVARTAKKKPAAVDACPVDKDELGRGTWALLHTMAAYYPDKPSTEQKVYAELMFKSLASLYPCKICAAHMQECIAAKPPRTDSRTELCLWVCELHNEVNVVLGKEVMPCSIEALDSRWRYGSKENNCWGEGDTDGDRAAQEKL
jgi:mitochondrial FAD-linked sulfhydryl oxidase